MNIETFASSKDLTETNATAASGTDEKETANLMVEHYQKHLKEVESLVNDFKHLLVRHETQIDQEGIREQLETLERWAESYRRGLKAAGKLSELGQGWLKDAQDKLKLSADELQRLDAESPQAGTREQLAKTEEYLKAIRKIQNLLPIVEQTMTPQSVTEPEVAQ